MREIKKTVEIPKRRELVFDLFVNRLGDWWPRDYTWSKRALVHIGIDATAGGLCTETGPFGFRCDWGRVLQVVTGAKLIFLWQISAARTPEPDPDRASVVSVDFRDTGDGSTLVELHHTGFENHGEEAALYVQAMDGDMGWEQILALFSAYARGYQPPV